MPKTARQLGLTYHPETGKGMKESDASGAEGNSREGKRRNWLADISLSGEKVVPNDRWLFSWYRRPF